MKAPDAARHRLLPPLQAWLLGMVIGLVGTWFVLFVPLYGLPLFAILATALVLRGPRAAFGGAILLMTGLWFTYLDLSMKARCAEMNHDGGFCQVMNRPSPPCPVSCS